MEALLDGHNLITDAQQMKNRMEEYCKQMGQTYQQYCTEPNRRALAPTTYTTKWELLEEEFNMGELQQALRKLRNGKACGCDEIANEFLKQGGTQLRYALLQVFNAVRESWRTPPAWAEEKLLYIHKSKSKLLLDNYRGISLASNIGKLFGRLFGQ